MPIDKDLFAAIAMQMISGAEVNVDGKQVPVRRIGAQRLRTVTFTRDGREYKAIEQNPEKPSRWGQLARSGHRVVQFTDTQAGKFVAVCVDGKVREYSK
jgi:hypothetical protein